MLLCVHRVRRQQREPSEECKVGVQGGVGERERRERVVGGAGEDSDEVCGGLHDKVERFTGHAVHCGH